MSKGLFGRIEQEIAARDKAAGLTMADLLSLPAPQRRLAQWLLREGDAGLPEAIAQTGQDEATVRGLLGALIDAGFVRETTVDGAPRYSLRVGARRKRDLPASLWSALGAKLKDEG
ncbi:hypothetical protein SE17_10240 [Kouleothrix aurantiaca]|jgi:hypothetical protein|uniref:HTH marR-type domain-containing protein n=1 Tax=Kouleothrix aurantiaca TaxID=186479 RepID=A0A0P9HEY5_9CHLR|nr:hypothetical protein SE17_10240 [Kouleothrix aurantiaca]